MIDFRDYIREITAQINAPEQKDPQEIVAFFEMQFLCFDM